MRLYPAVFGLALLGCSAATAEEVERIEYLSIPPRVAKIDKVVAWVRAAPIYEWEVVLAVCQNPKFCQAPDAGRPALANDLYRAELRKLVERELIIDDYVSRMKRRGSQAWRKMLAAADQAADKQFEEFPLPVHLRPEGFLRRLLACYGTTPAGLHWQWQRDFMRRAIVQETLQPKFESIGPKQLRGYYDAHVERFRVEASVKWQDLFVRKDHFADADAARGYAEQLLQRAGKEDFASLVQFDEGISRWNKGFGLGEKKGEINPAELEQTIFDMKQGEARLIDFGAGFHIIRIVERTVPGKRPYADVEVRREIREQMESEVGETAYRRFVDSLWHNAGSAMTFLGDSLEPQLGADFQRRADAIRTITLPVGAAERMKARQERESAIGALFSRGLVYTRNGDFDPATKAFGEIIRLDPQRSTAFKARGWAELGKNEIAPALDDVSKALELDPDDTEARRMRAMALSRALNYTEALAEVSRLVEADPTDAQSLLGRGAIYEQQCCFDNAIADYSAAIAFGQDTALTFAHRGDCHAWNEDLDLAIADYTAAIRLDARCALALHRRADAYFAKHMYSEAFADYRRTLRLDPKNWQALACLAKLRSVAPLPRIYNARRAVLLAKRACKRTHWQNSKCLEILAAAYAEHGDFKNAARWEAKAIELDDLPSGEQRLHQRLEAYKNQVMPADHWFDD